MIQTKKLSCGTTVVMEQIPYVKSVALGICPCLVMHIAVLHVGEQAQPPGDCPVGAHEGEVPALRARR